MIRSVLLGIGPSWERFEQIIMMKLTVVMLMAVAHVSSCQQLMIHGYKDEPLEELATKEAWHYMQKITGWRNVSLVMHQIGKETTIRTTSIIVATRGSSLLSTIGDADALLAGLSTEPDAHLIRSVMLDTGVTGLLCVGSSPRGTLYAVYSLLEEFGMRFQITGDVAPPVNSGLTFPRSLHKTFSPKFAVRGLQPFHDFPMGPDYWQPQFWRSLASNMAKIKMNFFGFHTYPISRPSALPNPEPAVWIGTADGYNHTNGQVFPQGSYETSWYQTVNYWTDSKTQTIRGNVPGQVSRSTQEFCCGASQIFERDCYGSEAQSELCFPSNPVESAEVFNNAGSLLKDKHHSLTPIPTP